MEQPALRPRPMPGNRRGGDGPGGPAGRAESVRASGQHAGRRRARRLTAVLLGALAGALLVLSGVGLGAMGVSVVGAGRTAGPEPEPGAASVSGPSVPSRPLVPPGPGAAPVPVVARLGVEVADGRGPGARVVGVHEPGPGFSAGLVRGDVLLAFGGTRVDSAADLARAVARARPGDEVELTVRHREGAVQRLTAVPGIVT
ncbi:PDZ domain-containing protein [Streptomyces sp. enrichment culture]|uniref:PDZ domain-containing protein n=1 Tax=Streptomyces sp. enrichment culture TaxID=1795815 RepID=UPI003F5606FC